jgi:hypothetical protein
MSARWFTVWAVLSCWNPVGVGTTFILSIPLHYSEEQSQVS